MALRFEENVYSFRAQTSFLQVHPGLGDGGAGGAKTLAEVEATLSSAHDAYLQRRYQDAIAAYKRAATMIYSYLEPDLASTSPSLYGSLPKHPGLFDPLVSVGAEYLNVLALPTAPDVTPRVAVDQAALGDDQSTRAGLHSARLASPAARAAFADLQSAARLDALGLIDNAAFYAKRAAISDPELAQLLAAAGQPAAAPAPGAPAVPGPGRVRAGRRARAAGPQVAAAVDAPGVAHAALADPAHAGIAVEMPFNEQIAAAAERGLAAVKADGAADDGADGAAAGALPAVLLEARTLGLQSNGDMTELTWTAGDTLAPEELRKQLYDSRVSRASMLGDILLRPKSAADVALALGHDYYYVIPLGIAEAQHALGDYAAAEAQYQQAATYRFLNVNVEAAYLWLRLATLYLDWGNALFIQGRPQDAVPLFANVIGVDDSVPDSYLYATAALKVPAGMARQVIAGIADLSKLPNTINPALIAAIVEVRLQLLKINNALDFWGVSADSIPIWTFDYLQSVAINFAQLAISAEKDFISYQGQADQATVQRQSLVQSVMTSGAEVAAAQRNKFAAAAETDAYRDGLALAQQRAGDARTAVTAYKNASWSSIRFQATSAQISGGDDADPDMLTTWAEQALYAGVSLNASPAHDARGVAPVAQLAGLMANRDYEVGSMERTANEMDTAAIQAQDELTAAEARETAASYGQTVASLRWNAAREVLDSFDAPYFTADVWQRWATRCTGSTSGTSRWR